MCVQLFFTYEAYRVVFCLHITRSLFSFQGDVLPIDEMERALASCLTVRPQIKERPLGYLFSSY